ncbi:hypothetical protein BH10CYA1_BH10CYA1_52310 [soil metagenome]
MFLNRLAPSLRKILAVSLASSAFVMPLYAFAEKKSGKGAELSDAELAKAAIHRLTAIPAQNSTTVSTVSPPSPILETAPKVSPDKEKPVISAEQSTRAVKEAHLLKGSVTHASEKSPLLYDKVQDLPKGTTINLVSLVNINSNVNVKGDEIWVRVGNNVHGQSEVAVPGGWYMHGLVTDAAPAKRGGIDGYVTVSFDKLVSPDRQLEVPFDAHISSKNSTPKAIAKHLLIDSGHVGLGALGGSIMAVQFGGIGTAIATHGISVGVGAGIGATVGLIGAAKRKGSISAIVPGEQMKLVVAQPVSLPGFDADLIPSAKPIAKLKNFEVLINKSGFSKDPYGDNHSKLLTLNLTLNNRTPHEYGFSSLRVVSDTEEVYYPDGLLNGGGNFVKKKVKPNTTENAVVAFSVDGKRHKYWLVLLDRINQQELNRVPIN